MTGCTRVYDWMCERACVCVCVCAVPDGQADFPLDLRSDLIHRSHQQLPEQEAGTPHTLPVLLRLGVKEPEHHLDRERGEECHC